MEETQTKNQHIGPTQHLLTLIRQGKHISLKEQLELAIRLSIPAIVAQVSYIIMQYIDASMVGSLGAHASAAIGLVSTTTWLFWGVCVSCATGFSVQVAHQIGAGNYEHARSVLRQSFVATGCVSLLLALLGCAISAPLPLWLGGEASIHDDATRYFRIFTIFLPALQLNFLAGGMLRCSGDMKVPSILNVVMCVLDVIFNFFFIFPSRHVSLMGLSLPMPGLGLGVTGAALGTVMAETIIALVTTWYLCTRSKELAIHNLQGRFLPTKQVLIKALKIGFPMGIEHIVICAAQIMTTVIVAPLGLCAIAANAFAVTAESLCYMPGYGIADAATTLIGQSIGAGRKWLTLRFARITMMMGMTVMGVMGVIMYAAAPIIIGIMTPDAEILRLGTMALRVEAWAEPMFAAAIVGYAIFVGAGDTMMPCLMNFFSIWAVRITLAALLAPSLGLKGVWVAMCIELCFRGAIFILRLEKGRWIKPLSTTIH